MKFLKKFENHDNEYDVDIFYDTFLDVSDKWDLIKTSKDSESISLIDTFPMYFKKEDFIGNQYYLNHYQRVGYTEQTMYLCIFLIVELDKYTNPYMFDERIIDMLNKQYPEFLSDIDNYVKTIKNIFKEIEVDCSYYDRECNDFYIAKIIITFNF